MTRKIIYLTVTARRSMGLGPAFIGPGHEVVLEQPVRPKLSPPVEFKASVPEMKAKLRDTLRVTRELRLDLSARRLLAVLKERDPGLYEEVRKVWANLPNPS